MRSGEEVMIEGGSIKRESKERKNLEEIRDGYVQIIEKLNIRVKKPL
jgi:hypothetical protein